MSTATFGNDVPGIFRVNPFGFTMSTLEQFALGFDTTNQLSGTQSPSNPVCILTDITTTDGVVISLANSPVVSGNVIIQVLSGTQLTAAHNYLLAVTYSADDFTTFEMVQAIWCPM